MKSLYTDRRRLGKSSEDAAAEYLRKNGMRPVERNYRCAFGEVDIIAKDRDCLVFVEVRSSRTASFVHPKFSIGPKKKRTLSKVALSYLKEKGLMQVRSRFDVITVVQEGEQANIEWTQNAFEVEW